uniref:Uncharacterized protein n=1 Tax=Anguilla anguilla TaxID=7936 RepID=A0A0E9UH18_ANGAN
MPRSAFLFMVQDMEIASTKLSFLCLYLFI